MVSTSRGGHRARQGDAAGVPSTAYQLLGDGWTSDIGLGEDWLSDLEANRLVITPDYVGPPRRRDDQLPDAGGPVRPAEAVIVEPALVREPGVADGRPRSTLRRYHLVVAVLVTVFIVVPLTLVATHVF